MKHAKPRSATPIINETITKEDTMSDTTAQTEVNISDTSTATQPARKRTKEDKPKTSGQPRAAEPPNVRILKVGHCPSLSGRSDLTYHVGCIGNAIQIRVYQNTGKGYFNQEWLPYSAIKDLITHHDEFAAGTLRSIFVGKSVNTAGFFMAVLKHLGLIETSKAHQRFYTHRDSASFEDQAAELIASGVSIEVAERDTTQPGRKGKLKP